MEFIKNIEIKNFKSIRDAKIEDCRRINVFIGYPNVGKSNLLEAIALYSVLQLGDDYFNFNQICRVKHFSELFFNQDSREQISVKINEEIVIKLSLTRSNELELVVDRLVDHNRKAELTSIFSTTIDSSNFRFNYKHNPVRSDYKYIIAPIRKYEFQKEVTFNRQKPYSLAMPDGDNLLDILQRDGEVRKEIKTIFDTYGLKLFIERTDYSIKFIKELNDGTAVAIPYHQVADTLRRLIFFKAAIRTNTASILLFEEPEAHMFPPYIAKFTSDIWYKKDNQYFISTHSPFVINDFMESAKDELAIYVLDYDNGETTVKRLTDKEIYDAYQYGLDLFVNIKSFVD